MPENTPTPGDLVVYEPQTWVDVPPGTTPPPGALAEDAASLNRMEQGIHRGHLVAVAAWALLQIVKDDVEALPADIATLEEVVATKATTEALQALSTSTTTALAGKASTTALTSAVAGLTTPEQATALAQSAAAAAVSALIDGAPDAANTLRELEELLDANASGDAGTAAALAALVEVVAGKATPAQIASAIAGLAAVARTGSYNDLLNKPTIPAAPDLTPYLTRSDASATYGQKTATDANTAAIAALPTTYIAGVKSDTAPGTLPAGAVWLTTRRDTTPPTVPTGLAAAADATGVSLTWNPSTDDSGAVAGYRVYRTPSGGSQTLLNPTTPATSTSYRDTTAVAGTSYTYTVAALDPFDNASAQSTASAAVQLISSIFPAAGKIWEFVAADLALADGAAVTAIPNRISGQPALASGDGISGHTSSPTYRTGLNSRPVVVFDGVDDFMGAGITSQAQPSTRILVGRFVTTGASKTLMGTRVAGSLRNVLAQNASTKWNAYAGTNLPHSGNVDTNLHLLAVVYNGTSSIIYVDGVAVTGSAGTEAAGSLRIGAGSSAADTLPSSFTNMAFGEGASYSKAMTTAELDSIRTAAKAIWTELP